MLPQPGVGRSRSAALKPDHAPVCQVAVEIERLKGQTLEFTHQFGFLIRRDQLGLVAKSFGKDVMGTKQITLTGDRKFLGYSGCGGRHGP